jgi:hypothetical protein
LWRLDNVQQGTIEITIETKCRAPDGAPEEVSQFREEIISGVYDYVPPEQYGGRALPLRNDILFGEEMQVIFTENIWCEKPQLFTIEISLLETDITMSNKNGRVQVNCRENVLGFHIKNMLPENVAGKDFRVVIDGVEDRARNAIENSIIFRKRFANLDLDGASTTFKFTLSNTTCTKESAEAQSDEVRHEIASKIGLEAEERVQIHSLMCLDDSKLIADAEIAPEERQGIRRKLIRNTSKSPRINIYETVLGLQGYAENTPSFDYGSRALLKTHETNFVKISAVGIKPSKEDILKYSSTKDELSEEEILKSFDPEKQFQVLIDTEHSDRYTPEQLESSEEILLKELQESISKEKSIEREDIKFGLAQLEGNIRTENVERKKEMDELRVRDEERMEEMKEEQRELKEMIRKLSEGGGKQEMTPMYMLQVGIIVFGCMVVGLALFQHNKR